VSIADGRLFTMGDRLSIAEDGDDSEYLLCFDVSNGQLIWKTRLGEPWDKGSPDWQSSRSTPTVAGNSVFVLTPFGDLVCCAAADGAEKWRKNMRTDFDGSKGDNWGYSEAVFVDGDRVICTPGGEENTVVALNKQNGEVVWSCSRPGDPGAGHSSIVESEVGGAKVYVQVTAGGPIGVRAADGKLLWEHPLDRTTAAIPTPIVKDDLVFYTAGYDWGGGLLRQVAAEAGEVRVEEVYAMKSDLKNKHGGVLLLNDYLYGDTDSRGTPYCAELMTGEIQWKERSDVGGRQTLSLTAADGKLYMMYANGVVVLAEATPQEYREISSFELPDPDDRPNWAYPVVAGGRLFLRVGDSVHCYDVSAK
jgi:outer membrane protein assembly factor BamB